MVCAHEMFESQVVVEKREEYVVAVHLRVRCTQCPAFVVFNGFTTAVEGHFHQVAVAQHGTEVILAGQMASTVEAEEEPWATATVHSLVRPQTEDEPLQPSPE